MNTRHMSAKSCSLIQEAGRPKAILVVLLILMIASATPSRTLAHSGEEEEEWLVSHFIPGNLSMTPDSSAPQWSDAKMLMIDDPDATLLSANNGTFLVILVQTNLETDSAVGIVALRIQSPDSNGSSQLWYWSSTHGDLPGLTGEIANGGATVAFGFQLTSTGTGIDLKTGTPYHNLIELAKTGNSSDPETLNFALSVPFSLELVSPMDHYPKLPLFYSVILIAAGLWFIFAEDRRYRRVRP